MSGSLSAGIQALAWHQKRPLPFGVGFTGGWDDGGKLRGVTDLGLKLQAAANAGVFLLFACQDEKEAVPDPVERVRLVLLPEGIRIDEVVRQVNRACAESGVTEFRWRSASRALERKSSSRTDSRDLPKANDKDACPVGFVGREQTLARLRDWREEARRAHGRQIHAVVGAARAGKTTLLSEWANGLPFFPVWFSFRRRLGSVASSTKMEGVIAVQIDARFAVLHLTTKASNELGRRASPERKLLINAVAATDAAIDIVVDGIDEVKSVDEAESLEEQRRVLRYLQSVPGKGLLLVGSQPIDPLERFEHVAIELRNDGNDGKQDALTLLEHWAKHLDEQDWGHVASDLKAERWRRSIVERSGGNLAVVNDAMQQVLKRGASWPDNPEDLPLAKEFYEYCRLLLNDIERSSPADFALIDKFIAFRAFLDDGPWRVSDVLRLMGSQDDEMARLKFLDHGPPGIERFLLIKDDLCHFQSQLLHDFARQHYDSFAASVATQFIKSLADPTPIDLNAAREARGAELSGNPKPPPDLPSFAVRALPRLIADRGDASLVAALMKSSWLYRRLVAIGNDISCDFLEDLLGLDSDGQVGIVLKLLAKSLLGLDFDRQLDRQVKLLAESGREKTAAEISRVLDRSPPESQLAVAERAPVGTAARDRVPDRLAEVMHELFLLNSLPSGPAELSQAIDFLAYWGPQLLARPGSVMIDQLWDAAPALCQFP
ncbi:MAG: hypothetical protein ACREHD_08400, partial [Pirellulales bacterium]